jgi:hypothetical protein
MNNSFSPLFGFYVLLTSSLAQAAASVIYSGRALFDYFDLDFFVVLFSSSRKIPEFYLKLCHYHLQAYMFRFILCTDPVIRRFLFRLSYWQQRWMNCRYRLRNVITDEAFGMFGLRINYTCVGTPDQLIVKASICAGQNNAHIYPYLKLD